MKKKSQNYLQSNHQRGQKLILFKKLFLLKKVITQMLACFKIVGIPKI